MARLPKRADRSERLPSISLRDEINRVFDDFFTGLMPQGTKGEWAPALDVSETDSQVVVEAEVPGMEAKDIEVSLVGDVLTIKGEKKEESEKKEENYYRMERRYGSFQRAVSLPSPVDGSKVAATYKNGVLKVTLDKKEESKSKSIKVKVQ